MKPDLLVLLALQDGYLDRLANEFTVHNHPRVLHPDELPEAALSAKAVLTNGSIGITATMIERLHALESIHAFGVGYENIDVEAARTRGVVVTHGPGTNAHSVADLAICLMLCVSRRIVAADAAARAGEWQAFRGTPTPTIGRRRLGLIGLGRIGLGIARRAAAAEMTVSYCARSAKPDLPYDFVGSVRALAEASDYLVAACPGGPETRHLVDATVLDALGADGYFVNVARGSVVDTDALIAALQSGSIAGAALDVFEDEPNVPAALTELDNVVLTPHIGGNAADATEAKYLLYLDNIRAHLAGRSVVTPVP